MPPQQIETNYSEVGRIDERPDCRVKDWSSTLWEVSFHKSNEKEAGITDVESKKANDVGKEAHEVEFSAHKSKNGYSTVVPLADAEKDQKIHANTFTDEEYVNSSTEKNNDEEDLDLEKDAYTSNNPRARQQSNNAYFRITSIVDTIKIGSEDLSPKISEGNKAKNSLALENLSNTTNVKDREDTTKGNTEDSTEKNPNPPSIIGPSSKSMNNSIATIKLEVKDNNFVKANGKRIMKNTASSTSIRELLNVMTTNENKKGIILEETKDATDDNIKDILEDNSDKALVTIIHCNDDVKNIYEEKAIEKIL